MVLRMINRLVLKWKVKKGIDSCSSRTSLLSDFFQFGELMVIIGMGRVHGAGRAEPRPRCSGFPDREKSPRGDAVFVSPSARTTAGLACFPRTVAVGPAASLAGGAFSGTASEAPDSGVAENSVTR